MLASFKQHRAQSMFAHKFPYRLGLEHDVLPIQNVGIKTRSRLSVRAQIGYSGRHRTLMVETLLHGIEKTSKDNLRAQRWSGLIVSMLVFFNAHSSPAR